MKMLSFIILFNIMGQIYAQNDNYIFNSVIDLNGDSVEDSISVEAEENGSEDFCLKVNNLSVFGTLFDRSVHIDGFKIIDINVSDKFKEIAVHSPGPSDDDEFAIYCYNGDSLLLIDRIQKALKINGDGTIYAYDWEGFWASIDQYLFDDKTKKLKIIPQFANFVGVDVEVTQPFNIFREKELINQVVVVPPFTKIMIMICDNKEEKWSERLFLIKTESRLIGWAKFKDFSSKTIGYNFAD